QQAHNNVVAGGEIGVLTPGDYGPVSIIKAVDIASEGVGEASISVGIGPIGVFINAGAGDVMNLRGLVIDGGGVANFAVGLNTGSAVHVENCVLRNVEGAGFGYGIAFQPHAASQLFVSDTIVFNNGSSQVTAGILIRPLASGTADVVLDRVQVQNNVIGLEV